MSTCWWDAPHDRHEVGFHTHSMCPGKTAAEVETSRRASSGCTPSDPAKETP
jgi:hypothetical protein